LIGGARRGHEPRRRELKKGRKPFFNILLGEGDFPTVAAAKEAGVATLNYGAFIQTMVDFTLIAFAIFMVIKLINRLRRHHEEAKVAKPAPAPTPSEEVLLLREIRDSLKK
jgi:large conductance mechanosensitive channel